MILRHARLRERSLALHVSDTAHQNAQINDLTAQTAFRLFMFILLF
jgi:hypothetical protein